MKRQEKRAQNCRTAENQHLPGARREGKEEELGVQTKRQEKRAHCSHVDTQNLKINIFLGPGLRLNSFKKKIVFVPVFFF